MKFHFKPPIFYKYCALVLALKIIFKCSDVEAYTIPEWKQTNFKEKGLTSIEVVPFGLLATQEYSNTLEDPHNGVFFSPDFGLTWKKLGLKGMGITDVRVKDDTLFASAYYSFKNKPGGLYYSQDYGKTWTHIGKDFHATALEISDKGTIYMGTRYNAVWLFTENLSNWWKYTSVPGNLTHTKNLYKEGIFLFIESSPTTSPYSENPKREKKDHRLISINNSVIIRGTDGDGLMISTDRGASWEKTDKLKNFLISDLARAGKNIFAVVRKEEENFVDIYFSNDYGKTWSKTNFRELVKTEDVSDFAEIREGTKSRILVSTTDSGILETKIDYAEEKKPFLGQLWEGQGKLDLIDRLTSFFDHEYPLLGYSLYSEPKESSNTTLNFLGQREKEPTIYYSSHNGCDFALEYGTFIKAPAKGIANYYYCSDCGHSIKIDHENGYETTYMHLQEEGLLTKNSKANIKVEEGKIIGKVGMTGRTTGPHLHFQVKKDSDNDGSFNDEYPDGMVDPFGWKNPLEWDPWSIFTWKDNRGFHQGTKSIYLWKIFWHSWEIKKLFKQNPILMDLGNISVDIPEGIKPYPLYLSLQKSSWIKTQDKKYIPNTSFLVEAKDSVGNLIHSLDDYLTIRIKIPNKALSTINPENLKISHWNESTKKWEPLNSVWDKANKIISAKTNEISSFAVLADNTGDNLEDAQLLLEGKREGYWFIEHPTVEIYNPNVKQIYYSEDGIQWKNYTNPFLLEQEGIIPLRYTGWDPISNSPITQIKLIRINTGANIHKTLKFTNLEFRIK